MIIIPMIIQRTIEMDTDRLQSAAYHILPVNFATVVLNIGCIARHVPINTARKIGTTYFITIALVHI